MVLYVIITIVVAIIAFIGGIFTPYSKRSNFLDEQESKIESNKNEISKLDLKIATLNSQHQDILLDFTTRQEAYNSLLSAIDSSKANLDYIQNLTKAANESYDEKIQSEKERLSLMLEKLAKDNEAYVESYNEDLLADIQYFADAFKVKITSILNEYAEYQKSLDEARNNVNLAIEAAKRAIEQNQKNDFYRISLQKQDISEIARLKEIALSLRNPEPLYKVIWRVYYQNPASDMINRVLGKDKHCGIYKITNLNNGMSYVGQAVDVSERWKQHIKRGLGAEPITRNKLYPAMFEEGPENFSFELLEDCERSALNEREKYWIEYFHGQDFGYNVTSGG